MMIAKVFLFFLSSTFFVFAVDPPAPTPTRIYRDPCIGWGQYDYGMGSAEIQSWTSPNIPANNVLFTRQELIYEGSQLLAKVELQFNLSGPVTASIVEQYTLGTPTLDVVDQGFYPGSFYDEFVEAAADILYSLETGVPVGTPMVAASKNAGWSGKVQLKIIGTGDDATFEYLGEIPYIEYFRVFLGIYKILPQGNEGE